MFFSWYCHFCYPILLFCGLYFLACLFHPLLSPVLVPFQPWIITLPFHLFLIGLLFNPFNFLWHCSKPFSLSAFFHTSFPLEPIFPSPSFPSPPYFSPLSLMVLMSHDGWGNAWLICCSMLRIVWISPTHGPLCVPPAASIIASFFISGLWHPFWKALSDPSMPSPQGHCVLAAVWTDWLHRPWPQVYSELIYTNLQPMQVIMRIQGTEAWLTDRMDWYT